MIDDIREQLILGKICGRFASEWFGPNGREDYHASAAVPRPAPPSLAENPPFHLIKQNIEHNAKMLTGSVVSLLKPMV